MPITPDLAVDLALLTQALDRPEADMVETVHQFAVDARLAVRSYLGLSLTTAGNAPFVFTALREGGSSQDIRSSLLIPLPSGGADTVAAGPALILYATQAGAFVDLAADLSWLTGVELSEYAIDQHLPAMGLLATVPTVHATSVINQAIGLLIGRGHLPDEAHKELATQAIDAGTDRYTAAAHILSTLATDPDPTHDPR